MLPPTQEDVPEAFAALGTWRECERPGATNSFLARMGGSGHRPNPYEISYEKTPFRFLLIPQNVPSASFLQSLSVFFAREQPPITLFYRPLLTTAPTTTGQLFRLSPFHYQFCSKFLRPIRPNTLTSRYGDRLKPEFSHTESVAYLIEIQDCDRGILIGNDDAPKAPPSQILTACP